MENIIYYDENLDITQKQNKFWNYIKNTRKDNTGVSPVRKSWYFLSYVINSEYRVVLFI